MEEWRLIAGFEGKYAVSNLGRVKRLERLVCKADGVSYTVSELVMKPLPHTSGYLQICLRTTQGVTGRMRYIHRLVGAAFLSNPDRLPEINHKNLDKLDNRLENLEWVRATRNMLHAAYHGRLSGLTNPNTRKKLTPESAASIRSASGPLRQIARDYAVSEAMVRLIKAGKRWADPREVHKHEF